MKHFCHNCGKQLSEGDVFCTECGTKATFQDENKVNDEENNKWWYRLAKVIYIFSYVVLVIISIAVWFDFKPYCTTYAVRCYGSYEEAFWYTLLTFVFGILILRLFKITFLYIVFGKKPLWDKELTSFF